MISYTHRYDSLYPYNNRRCGYIFSSATTTKGWVFYNYGTSNGGFTHVWDNPDRPLCTKWDGATTSGTAICGGYSNDTCTKGTCPKGWGMCKNWHQNDSYTVYNAQGFYRYDNPIYSTVTKYRDVVYNYITTRVAKA